MSSHPERFVAQTIRRFRGALQHAFAIQQPSDADWSATELALLDRVADAIVKRGMAAPATMFLESLGPMNFLGSQALHFMSPIIECAFHASELTQVAHILERRDSLSRLTALIETKSAPPRGAPAR